MDKDKSNTGKQRIHAGSHKTNTPANPSKRQREETLSSPGTISPTLTQSMSSNTPDIAEILLAIENRLSGLDARLVIVEMLHKEFQALRQSLEFGHAQIETLAKENTTLKQSVGTLTSQLDLVTAENKKMKESILDIQARSMRDNLIFTGITEQQNEDPEKLVKNFITDQLKLPAGTANNITFHRVHRLGQKNAHRPRPIIAKFEHFKQKMIVQKQGRELRGTNFGMNDQFPPDILQRRKTLFPIRKQLLGEGKKAVIVVDKLYIEGQLYRDKEKTPWLY